MSKITKKELQYQINGLAAEASTRHNSIMRIHRALASIGVDIFSDDFDLTEPKPQFKQLDKSVFDGIDEKWLFAAVDKGGEVWVYSGKPERDCGYWFVKEPVGMSIGRGYDASNWQNSLIERDIAKELTGSDLCRAMLERGDKYVMCKTSGTGEAEAMEAKYPDVIQKYDWEFFYTPYKKRYAVPINNKGEPLTAAEAGL